MEILWTLPSVRPSVRHAISNHCVEFNQTRYITSPRGKDMQEEHYFSIHSSIILSVTLSSL